MIDQNFEQILVTPTQKTDRAVVVKIYQLFTSVINLLLKVDRFE